MAEDNKQKIASLMEENVDTQSLDREQEKRQKDTNRGFSYGGSSKTKFVIESSNWGASLEERRNADYELGAQIGPRRDPVREAGGKYWGYDKEASETGGSQSVLFISKGRDSNPKANVPFRMWVSEPMYNYKPESFAVDRNPFFEVEQVVRLYANKKMFTDVDRDTKEARYRSDNWRSLIEGEVDGKPTGSPGIVNELVDYSYFAFDMQMPFNYKELDNLGVTGAQFAKIRPEYNFYIKKYEEMLRFGEGLNQPEAAFPNLYAMVMEKINEVSNESFKDHVTLGDTMGSNEATVGAAKKNKFDIKKHTGQYFDIYGQRFETALENAVPSIQVTANKFKNIVVPIENIDLLKEISDKKELFPMFVDMEFSTDKMTEFAQMLSDTTLTNDFMWHVVKDVVTSQGANAVEFVEALETSDVTVQEDGTPVVTKNLRTDTRTRRVWNIFSWLKGGSLVDFDTGAVKPPDFSSESESTALESSVFLDDGSIEQNLSIDPKKRFFKSLMGLVFIGKLKTFLKQRFRTYDQIIEGHPVHTETVLYRVQKTLADIDGQPTGGTIQNFWFPNTNQIDVLKLVDTQVKYQKHYAYRIYAYQLAVSTSYSYEQAKVWDDQAAFVVRQKPEVLLVEQELFLDDHIIMDDPPVPPEVEIVPYFADGHRLLFRMNSTVGEYHLDPIALNEEDEQQHMNLRRSQKIADDAPLRFKNDDPVGHEGYFEIYRIDRHPRSWSDFDGQLLAAVANNPAIGETISLAASSAEHIDYISSNRKYYYTFRMVDAHGHVSNPTTIYEVEIANDEGSIHFLKRPVDFAPVEPKHPAKKMRRLIQIKPAAEQTFVDTTIYDNDESAFQVKNLKLGVRQESPWGRKFKFRLVSRKTGKKLDLNVDFAAVMERTSTLK